MPTDATCQTYSVEEFAVVMGISKDAAYRLVKRDAIPHFRLGRSVRISKEWVQGLLEGRNELRESA